MIRPFLNTIVSAHQHNETFALVILIAKNGSAPQVPGAKGLFFRDGRIEGTIGGGCLEMEARRLALQCLQSQKTITQEFKMDSDFGWDDGLICGGRVQLLIIPESSKYIDACRAALHEDAYGVIEFNLRTGVASFIENFSNDTEASMSLNKRRPFLTPTCYIEPIYPPEKLFVFGAGHVGKMIAKYAKEVGFKVTLIDDRKDLLYEESIDKNIQRILELPETAATKINTDDHSFVCVVTRGHRNDSKVLKHLIKKPCAYIGMIGSRRKRTVIRKEMLSEGICTPEEFDRVDSPMGIDIGAESVEEIAISIIAKLIAKRSERRGPLLARCQTKQLSSVET